ncbi:MAG: hypothetical protein R3C49_03085 [Planctomycetaceae bacterium]
MIVSGIQPEHDAAAKGCMSGCAPSAAACGPCESAEQPVELCSNNKASSVWTVLVLVVFQIAFSGCQNPSRQHQVHRSDPALPMTLSRDELVELLNRQNTGLDGWKCMSTRLTAKMPGLPTQHLNGYIACQTPQYFRLTADNLIAKADLGSNVSRCWVYVKPGENAVMTWKHEDTALVQQMTTGIPYIDPNWLMLVLGIRPLDANDYELSRSADGKPELWLTAVEQSPTGRPLRRVIKVDTYGGVVREHAIYDSEGRPLVQALLSKHKSHDGHLIPTIVRLTFPQMDTELALSFTGIETNPNLPDSLWHLPETNVTVVDLGEMARHQMMLAQHGSQETSAGNAFSSRPRARLQPPVFRNPVRSAFAGESDRSAMDGTPLKLTNGVEEPDWATEGDAEVAEPNWETPISLPRDVGFPDQPTQPAGQRRGFLSRLFNR